MNKPKVIIFNYFLNPKYNFTQNIVDWYESMKKNYLIDCDRRFVVYTDNPNAKNVVKDDDIKFVDVDASKTKNIGENKLNKFKYILDCVNHHQFDYFSFIQSNARCVKPVTFSELVGDFSCDLVVFNHCDFPEKSFKDLYYNKQGSVVDISKKDTSKFIYIQNCHFVGNRKTIIRISKFINDSVDADYLNPLYKVWYKMKSPSIFDERYFNYYMNTVLLPEDQTKIKILDGNVYIHAPYSKKLDFKIDMIDKGKPYVSSKLRKVSILMASFPYRKKWMFQCIERLMPQCDNFYLWLNEYKEIPEELKKYDSSKLHITLGEKNLKENGRYMFLNKPELQDDYCFVCDDDINWPKDYVKNTIDCFHRNGDNIVIAYFINGGMSECHQKDEIQTGYCTFGGVPHFRFGAGTCVFVPAQVNFQYKYSELENHYDMELIFAQQCIDRKIKLYSPKRKVNWITFMKDTNVNSCEIEKFALSRNGNIANRSKTTYDYMKKCGRIKFRSIEDKNRTNKFKRFQFG